MATVCTNQNNKLIMIKNNYNNFNNKADLDMKNYKIPMGKLQISCSALARVCEGQLGEEEEHSSEGELLNLRAKPANEKRIQEILHGL